MGGVPTNYRHNNNGERRTLQLHADCLEHFEDVRVDKDSLCDANSWVYRRYGELSVGEVRKGNVDDTAT